MIRVEYSIGLIIGASSRAATTSLCGKCKNVNSKLKPTLILPKTSSSTFQGRDSFKVEIDRRSLAPAGPVARTLAPFEINTHHLPGAPSDPGEGRTDGPRFRTGAYRGFAHQIKNRLGSIEGRGKIDRLSLTVKSNRSTLLSARAAGDLVPRAFAASRSIIHHGFRAWYIAPLPHIRPSHVAVCCPPHRARQACTRLVIPAAIACWAHGCRRRDLQMTPHDFDFS
jgi:hypothetical protein